MTRSYYDPGEQRSQRVRELFGGIARKYDLINDLQSAGMHRLWKRKLVHLAGPLSENSRVLDVCCGTGDIALAFARRKARVMGLDFTPEMLEVARERAAAGADKNLEFITADAQAIPLPNDTFDVVVVGYGLRTLADLERGLREMFRVLKPGGVLLSLDFGKPSSSWLRSLYFGYLRFCIPLMGKLLCGDTQAYAYILESLIKYPGQQAVADLMAAHHGNPIRIINLLGGTMCIHRAEKPESSPLQIIPPQKQNT